MSKLLNKMRRISRGAAGRVSGSAGSFAPISFTRLSIKEQTFFAKRLAFLVRAGVPITECLHIIRSQTTSPSKVRILDTLIADVENGQYLSSSLGKFRRIFGDFAINLIRVGEHSGILSQNLAYLADELQKKHALRRKIIGALIYPIVITVATLGIVSLLTAYIFPKLMPIFTSLHEQLPFTTRALIAISAYLRHWGLLTLFALIAIAIGLFFLRRGNARVQQMNDRFLLRFPLVGSITRAYNLANFCRTLGLLLHSGITLADALSIVAETTPNLVFRGGAEQCAQGVIKGEQLSRGLLRRKDLYPPILTQMVGIGEATGNLSSTLTYLSELYEGDVEDLTKGLSSAIEPILMVIMGLLVGLIAISVITPIYELTQHLQAK